MSDETREPGAKRKNCEQLKGSNVVMDINCTRRRTAQRRYDSAKASQLIPEKSVWQIFTSRGVRDRGRGNKHARPVVFAETIIKQKRRRCTVCVSVCSVRGSGSESAGFAERGTHAPEVCMGFSRCCADHVPRIACSSRPITKLLKVTPPPHTRPLETRKTWQTSITGRFHANGATHTHTHTHMTVFR